MEIEFENGIPVNVDGKTNLADMMHHLNDVGGKNGIGKIDMFEDGLIGLKSREAYEAPAAEIILKLHKDLEHIRHGLLLMTQCQNLLFMCTR